MGIKTVNDLLKSRGVVLPSTTIRIVQFATGEVLGTGTKNEPSVQMWGRTAILCFLMDCKGNVLTVQI